MLNLAKARKRGSTFVVRLFRTAAPEKAAKRQEAEKAAAVPDKTARNENLLTGFEEMLSACARMVTREFRD